MFFNIRRKWSFHVVVLQGTSTKYAVTNIYNALVQLIAGAADYESSGRMQIILRIAYTTEMIHSACVIAAIPGRKNRNERGSLRCQYSFGKGGCNTGLIH